MCYLVWDESSSFGLDQLPPGRVGSQSYVIWYGTRARHLGWISYRQVHTVDCRVVVNDRNRTRARHLG